MKGQIVIMTNWTWSWSLATHIFSHGGD